MVFKRRQIKNLIIPLLICAVFFVLYSALSIVRHNHYGSYGYDLGINDQVVWEYSKFNLPITTIAPQIGKLKLVTHIEVIFALLSPFYWIWSNPIMLLILQSLFFCISGIAVYLLAKSKNLNSFFNYAILISYLSFYGVQNALWFDVHSIVFGASFLTWFLYFLQTKKHRLTFLFFFLAILSKENIGFVTFFIGFVYFIFRKDKYSFLIMLFSVLYLFFVFFIYFPYIINVDYLYANKGGILSNFDLRTFFDTQEKIQVIFYTLFSFGFVSLLNPFILIPSFGDLATYFIIASELPGAHGLYMHYRIMLSPLMAWGTIITVGKYKFLNKRWIGIYLILCTMFIQYSLHLPLSYLSKQWFWNESKSVKTINKVISDYLPKDASVVAQNNIIPHISERHNIYELYPEKKDFNSNLICKEKLCDWFRWAGSAKFLLVDTSSDWDSRHFLIDRGQYIKGLNNLEKEKIIKIYKKIGTTTLYKILDNPINIK